MRLYYLGPDEAMDTDASDRDSMNVVDRPQVSSVTDNKKEGNRIPETSVRRVKNTVRSCDWIAYCKTKSFRMEIFCDQACSKILVIICFCNRTLTFIHIIIIIT